MKIGVFDSGVGGLSVAQAIEQAMPEHAVVYRTDAEHIPYGLRSPKEILGFVVPILESMVEEGCKVIVIACNTVSTTLAATLRERINAPLIAMEPMIKPAAALTKTGVIAVCATPTTLSSPRYAWLKQEYAKNIKVVEPDCSSWAKMIEDNKVDRARITDEINDALALGADVVVLGCTHYHWIQDIITEAAGSKAQVIQPTPAILSRLRMVMAGLEKAETASAKAGHYVSALTAC